MCDYMYLVSFKYFVTQCFISDLRFHKNEITETEVTEKSVYFKIRTCILQD